MLGHLTWAGEIRAGVLRGDSATNPSEKLNYSSAKTQWRVEGSVPDSCQHPFQRQADVPAAHLWALTYLSDTTWLKLPSLAAFQRGNLFLEHRHHLSNGTQEVPQMSAPL